jgi:hypothetical protein
MKAILLSACILLFSASIFAQGKNDKTYPEQGTVVSSPGHDVYIVESATTRFKLFGHPTLEVNKVVHFRIDTGLKGFVVFKDGKEHHYWINGQELLKPSDSGSQKPNS